MAARLYGSQGTLRVRSELLFQSSYCIKIVVAAITTVLVLLQLVFMVWEIVLIISAW